MELIRQKLLAAWAQYWLHHTIRTTVEAVLAVVMVSGTAVTVVTVSATHHRAEAPKAAPVATAPKPAPKPMVKKPVAKPAPAPKPHVAAVAPVATPSAPIPAPKPIASSKPSPGTGVKKLVATPPPASDTTAPSSSTTTTDTTAPDTSTETSTPAAATGGYYSTNWSGYAALSGSFTAVSGSWTVPSVTGNGSDSTADAAWIGIGGVSSTDLIQTGTIHSVEPDGTTTYMVFYELLPAPAMVVTGFTVHAGDVMTASITEQSAGKWRIRITDTTNNLSYTTTTDYTSSYSSAEWIEEDPSYLDGSLVPFNNFGHVSFTGGLTTMDGVSVNIAGSKADPITLVDSSNKPIVTPSVLISSGTAFWAAHN